MTARVDPPAYFSVLYERLLALRADVEASYRGLGTPEQHREIGETEARIAGLEDDGPGSAFTPLDSTLWSRAARGCRVVVSPDQLRWVEVVCEAAGMPVPRAFVSKSQTRTPRERTRPAGQPQPRPETELDHE